MSDIVIRVPRRKKIVRIIKAKDLIEKELESYKPTPPPTPDETELELQRIAEEEAQQKVIAEAKEKVREKELKKQQEDMIPEIEIPIPDQTVFTQTFTIKNANEPTEISLKNIPPESITVNEAMLEVQSSYDSGFKHGKETSDAEFRKEMQRQDEWVRSIDNVIENMTQGFHAEMQKFEDVVISTAIAIAKKIITHEIDLDENIVINQVKKALELIYDEKIMEIRINPKDFKIIRKSKADLVTDETKMRDVEIIPDITIKQGECSIKTMSGNVESIIQVQLERLEKEMHEALLNPKYKEEKALDPDSEHNIDRILYESKPENSDEDYQRPDLTKLDLFKDY